MKKGSRIYAALVGPVLASLMAALPAGAQEGATPFRKAIFEVEGNVLVPNGNAGQISTGAGGGFGLAFRPWRFIQIDLVNADFYGNIAGPDRTTFVTNGVVTEQRSVNNHAAVVASGAQFTVPVFHEHLVLGLGAGYAGARVSESIAQNANETVACYSCRSRWGNGYYGKAEAIYFPGHQRELGIGFRSRWIQLGSNNLSLGSESAPGSHDNFLQLSGVLSLRFR